MTTKDDSTSPEEHKISKCYQSGAIEQPSSSLDQKILKQAKASVPEVEGKTNSKQAIRPKTWRKWQWSGSIAASVLLVSWLFMFNKPYYDEANLIADEQYIESKVVAKMQSEEATRARRLKTKPQLQIAASSEKEVGAITHNTSEKLVEDSSPNKLLMNDDFASLAKQEKDLAKTDASMADLALAAPLRKNLAAEKRIQATNGLAKNSDKPSPDYQYLDTLLENVLFYRQKMDSNQSSQSAGQPPASEQSSAHLESGNSTSAKKNQVEMFELLLEYKQGDPTWLVPQKYLNVLNQQQVRELARLSDVELHE